MTSSDPAIEKTALPKRKAKKMTRREQLHKMLTWKSGATIAQLQKTFGWKPHSARAAISAQRKAGCVVERLKTEKGAVYRIVEARIAP